MAQCNQCGKKGLLLKLNTSGQCLECASTAANTSQATVEVLTQEIASLKAMLKPEHNTILNLQQAIADLSYQRTSAESDYMNALASYRQNEADWNSNIIALRQTKSHLESEIAMKRNELIEVNDEIGIQEFGLYKPQYDFCNVDGYKNQLSIIRQNQKDCIKADSAVSGNMNWTVNGSIAQGKKMVKDMQKLLLRAFNGECDDIVEKVKYNNYEASLKRISASRDAISKLGKMMDVAISPQYYNLKIEELTLALEYRQQKQAEKEAQQEARVQMREEAKLRKEIEDSRRKAEKEKNHYENALQRLEKQLEAASETDRVELEEKIGAIKMQISDTEKAIKDIDYREANQRAGYVYIISNIGAFGENVFKIGMTRRLEPTERIDELGDASVPFNFDTHAMIFSEDAPALESALHRAFESRKLNMVNTRREFFRVTLDEIKAEVKKNYDKTAEFIEIPDAEQYRISEKMRLTGV